MFNGQISATNRIFPDEIKYMYSHVADLLLHCKSSPKDSLAVETTFMIY